MKHETTRLIPTAVGNSAPHLPNDIRVVINTAAPDDGTASHSAPVIP